MNRVCYTVSTSFLAPLSPILIYRNTRVMLFRYFSSPHIGATGERTFQTNNTSHESMSAHIVNNPHSRKFVVLLGGPAAGKNFVGTHLKDDFGQLGIPVERLVVGHIVEDERQNNQQFRDVWGPVMSRGELLPDEVIRSLFLSRYNAVSSPFVVIDGHCRKIEQVHEAWNLGFLRPSNCLVIILSARREVRLQRFHKRAQSDGKHRTDNEVAAFLKKSEDYENSIDSIVSLMNTYGVKPMKLDANRPLISVHKAVFFHVSSFWTPSKSDTLSLGPWEHSRNRLLTLAT